MLLKLEGHFSHIDKYNKLNFIYLWGDFSEATVHTKDRLIEHVGPLGARDRTLPMDREGFTVCLQKKARKSGQTPGNAGRKDVSNSIDCSTNHTTNNTSIPTDISSYVGLDCDIWVKLVKYSFTSNLEWNRGQKIEGTQLILQDIKPMAKYKL
jgi:hypothetical protein